MMMEISVIPRETSYENTAYHFQLSQGLDAAHMLMFTGPLLCVRLRTERNIEQYVKRDIIYLYLSNTATSIQPVQCPTGSISVPHQPSRCTGFSKESAKGEKKNQRLWGKKNITESKWKVLINAFKDLG